ncbi:related to TRM12 tRNA methyltransferase, required for the formation of the hypermodified nucleoside [Lecanosticta acicola]|uniref:tRNA wybutosine-synthesizing protein 2 n=1 Tax=Lecanosticta acicola TaxID=111012 RepID=A0AAI8YTZ1_9PEZI|nr:related to TRM12 tRNA methyltransferase, required for the formation of the hypermodified nucleoside [Lecanosticta acicola]
MDRAVAQWLSHTSASPGALIALTKKLNKSYTIYGTMLLLPPTAFQGPEWTDLEPNIELYKCISSHLKVTHIAINKPIPLHKNLQIEGEREDGDEEKDFNILRSPSNFTPLHGDFGPSTCHSPPARGDFESAFWITAKQNGIYQTWAPRWTMFSRGNISEKARLLDLASVKKAAEEGGTAVDLYAGIGYFAFSYVKAGIGKVLCWDLNAWSCEGLLRGARRNKWEAILVNGEDEDLTSAARHDSRLLVFNQSNERAPSSVKAMRKSLPPIRHVNCGMLPNSTSSLEIAVDVLDLSLPGWIHYHENFLVEEINQKAEDTRQTVVQIVEAKGTFSVQVEYINRLKNYAPGVMHCVIDLVIRPECGPPS